MPHKASYAPPPPAAPVRRYRGSKEEEDQQLKAARRLGKALFQHIKNDPTRTYLTREDFDPFFAGLHNAEAEADAAFFFFDKVSSNEF